MEVRDLRMVVALDAGGSIMRAARIIGVAPPSLSRSLSQLEIRLGGRLFDRSPRGLIPTDLGRTILAGAAEILARVEDLSANLAELRGHQRQDLTVVAGPLVGESLVLRAAARMISHDPTIRLRLVWANWAAVPRAVHDREAGIGLADLRGLKDDPTLTIERLRPQHGIFVVRPGHPLTRMSRPTLPEILAYPFIFIGRIPPPMQALLAKGREAAGAMGPVHPAFPAVVHESPTIALSILRESDAVAGVTVPLASHALSTGEIAAVRWREPWAAIHPGILRQRNVKLTDAEQGFLELLRNVDQEAEEQARAWCVEAGIDPTIA